MNEEKQEMMTDEELETISGGDVTIGSRHFSGHVGKYNGIVGHNYYIVLDGTTVWFYGKLLKTYEESEFVVFSKRRHKFRVTKGYGIKVPEEKTFSGDDVTLYTTMTEN